MKKIWSRKFSTLFGLIIITVGIVLTTVLVTNKSIFRIKAGPGEDPKNIKISNISDSSFTVSYLTDDQVIGTINYGIDSNNLDGIALDDRDQISQKVERYKSHSITIGNLDPNTKYYFSITSGNKNYINNGSYFETITGNRILDDPSSQIPISGRAILPNGDTPKDGLIYAKISDGQLISALLKENGTYTIPLNTLRNANLSEYLKIDSNTKINIDIYAEELFSSISVSTLEISPVPLVTLSGSYDFSTTLTTPTPTQSKQTIGFPEFGKTTTNPNEPKILTPYSEQNLESQPIFKGVAQPNETVEIIIHSDENIKIKVIADSKGNWEFVPTSELSPGKHTITIVTKNERGILKTITKSFTVFADVGDDSQTPLSTSKINISPSPALSKTPTINPEISSTQTIIPTGYSSVIIATIAVIAAAFTGLIIFFITREKNNS